MPAWITSELRELVCIPTCRSDSRTTTSRPARASARATPRPMTPAPITATSADSMVIRAPLDGGGALGLAERRDRNRRRLLLAQERTQGLDVAPPQEAHRQRAEREAGDAESDAKEERQRGQALEDQRGDRHRGERPEGVHQNAAAEAPARHEEERAGEDHELAEDERHHRADAAVSVPVLEPGNEQQIEAGADHDADHLDAGKRAGAAHGGERVAEEHVDEEQEEPRPEDLEDDSGRPELAVAVDQRDGAVGEEEGAHAR